MKTIKLEFVRGDDRSFRLLVLNPDKTPVEMAGAELDLHARTDEQEAPVIQLSTADGTIEVATGRVVLHFSHSATQRAEWQTANFDLQMKKDGKRQTLVLGKIKLIHDQTRV